MTMTDVKAALQAAMGGGGSPAWGWKVPANTTRKGTIISAEMTQQREMKKDENGRVVPGEPMWWPKNGGKGIKPTTLFEEGARPVPQIVITLKTDERDGAGDDGIRRDFVRSDFFKDLNLAIGAAGMDNLTPGAAYERTKLSEPGERQVFTFKLSAPTVSAADLTANVAADDDDLDF